MIDLSRKGICERDEEEMKKKRGRRSMEEEDVCRADYLDKAQLPQHIHRSIIRSTTFRHLRMILSD